MLILPPNSTLLYCLLALCLLLGLGLMAQAWWRPRRRQRVLRMGAGAGAAAALWLLVVPPARQVPVVRAEAILLTEGYSPDTLRRLRQQVGAGTAIWAYGLANVPAPARPLASLLTLAGQRPALRRLHVLGSGLPAADLAMLGPLAVRQHAGTPATGFRTAFWPAQLPLGAVLHIEGTVDRPEGAGTPAWVVLRAAGAGRDSVLLPAGGAGAFRLHYQPKVAGLATYALLLHQPGRPPLAEPLPVEITAPTRPAVLLLAAAPSFELKFLKNQLAEAHYPVALRTSVSRGLVQTDFLNLPALALDRLTPALLTHFSVLLADAATLAALTSAEAQALQAAVRGGRLGLIALAEAGPLPRTLPARAGFVVQPHAVPTVPQRLTWPNLPGEARAPLLAQVQAADGLRPLISGPRGAVAAAARRVGLGFVVVSAVTETFRWGLQGHQALYFSFWNQLLTAAVPPAPAGPTWHPGTRWPRPHAPLTLHLEAEFPATPPTVAALAGGPPVRLALRQDTRLPEWSTAPYWPTAPGWHQVRGPGRTSRHFYVYPTHSWPGPEQQERRQAAARLSGSTQAAPIAETTTEPWPAGWFFGLFLLAVGYLWLEEKL